MVGEHGDRVHNDRARPRETLRSKRAISQEARLSEHMMYLERFGDTRRSFLRDVIRKTP